MAFAKKARRVVRRAGRAVYRAAKKRYVKKGGPNVKNIYKDVMMLKGLINVEKKRIDYTSGLPASFAEISGAGNSGAAVLNITPVAPQGITNSTRNGNSIKLVSGCLDVQFAQSINATNAIRYRYAIVCRPDNSIDLSTANFRDQFYEPCPFAGVINYHSNRDPEYFTAFRVIKQGTGILTPDQIAGAISYKQLKIPLKFNHHLKFNTDASTTTTKNKFFFIVTADNGDVVTFSGGTVEVAMRWYYTDN